MSMQIDVLNRLEPAAANAALGIAAFMVVPDPGVRKAEPDENADMAQTILHEIRARLGLRPEDNSVQARSELGAAITSLIAAQVPAEDLQNAAERLGQSGDLSPQAYKVELGGPLKDAPKERFVRPKMVLDAVSNPDDFQHLEVPSDEQGAFDAISLFLKKFNRNGGASDAWLFVQSQRKGLVQTATTAWWVFPDEVDLSEAIKPVDVLEAFAKHYGFELAVGEHSARFFRVAVAERGHAIAVHMAGGEGTEVISSMLMKIGLDGNLYYQLAYAIDATKYKASVIRHGRSS